MVTGGALLLVAVNSEATTLTAGAAPPSALRSAFSRSPAPEAGKPRCGGSAKYYDRRIGSWCPAEPVAKADK